MPPQQRSFSRRSGQPRVRAGKACRRCNLKRIKCDAMYQMPCTNCVQSETTSCTLRETRRGTYTRQPRPGPKPSTETGPASPALHPQANQEPIGLTKDPIASTQSTPESANATQRPSSSLGSPGAVVDGSPVGSTGNASSYRDISWSAVFDHFLDSRKDAGKELIDKRSMTYLGESFPLAMILGDVNERGRPKLHHPGPPIPERQGADVVDLVQPPHITPEDLEVLKMKGVFTLPEKSQLDALMAVFVESVYPIYPLVNRQELIEKHTKGTVSIILLHSICFIAATFSPLCLLHRAGFTSRREARFFYYKKVKALFDSGYEINKIVILQSAILMSFWGGGPNNYWNFYSWISTAVTIAEGMGIHRSTATSNMQAQDKSLLRRLWWILVVRDSVSSALVGRPFRIDLRQSDTEMLTIEDFAHDASVPVPEFLQIPHQQTYACYQIEIARLSVILRDIVMDRFHPDPGRSSGTTAALYGRVMRWKEELPASLAWKDDTPDHRNPFTMTLSVQYHHHIILIYLGNSSPSPTPAVGGIDAANTAGPPQHGDDDDDDDKLTDSAAQHISTVAFAAVTRSSVLALPHEFFHAIFLAQTVFYTNIRSPNKLVAQMGRAALQSCQMVLHKSSESWDPSVWIMQLFDSLSTRWLERATEQGQGQGQDRYAAGPTDFAGLTGGLGSSPEGGVFNGLLTQDHWQSNPLLSSLFDFPLQLPLLE